MNQQPTDLEKFQALQNPRLKYASVNHYFKLFNKSQLDKIMSKPDNFKAELKRETIINRAIGFCNNPLPNYLKFKN